MSPIHLLLYGFLLAVLLSACGSNRSSATGSSASAGAGQTSGAATTQSGAANNNALPGTEEFGLSKQGLVEAVEAVESHIAQCMSEAGFEYVAVDYNTVRRGMVADKSLPGLGERRFMAEYGFGISTLYTGQPPQLSNLQIPGKIGLGDQNVRIFANLSAADQGAYSRTLFGENPDATLAVALETEDFTQTGGCTRAAIEQVFTPEQLTTTYLNPKDALIGQDDRMIAAMEKFSECLRAAGFDYAREQDIEPELRKRLFAITGGMPVESLSPEARTSLTQMQTEERALGPATLECESRYIDPVDRQVEIELFTGIRR